MWIRLMAALVWAAIAEAQTATAPITIVGEYSDNGHGEGCRVQLWQQGDTLLGVLMVEGLSEDGPIGVLESVKFDPRSVKR